MPGHGIVAIGKPSRHEYDRFIDTLSNDKESKAQAMRVLVMASLIHPDKKAAQAIFEDQPVLVTKLAARAQELGGSEIKELGNA